MKHLVYLSIVLFPLGALCQVESEKKEGQASKKDTTRFSIGNSEVIIISNPEEERTFKIEELDTIDASPRDTKKRDSEGRWSGIEFGVSSFFDQYGNNKFTNYPYWRIDESQSWYFNINMGEKKFKIIKEYVGLVTGFGFGFDSYAFENNYDLVSTPDTLFATISANQYSKNKLKASYFKVPLLLEFNTNADNDEGLCLAAGVIGGVRLSSKTKKIGESAGQEFESKVKGGYGLNSFRLDGTVRLSFDGWGAQASYGFLELFDVNKTRAVHPLTFGLTFNF